MNIPQSVLVDARSWATLKDAILAEIKAAPGLVGVDIETTDERRHAGLNRFMKVNPEGHKSSSKKLVFDTNRTDITGFSIYVDESPYAYYVNLHHADVENRLPWAEVKCLLDEIPDSNIKIAHNAPYELTMFRKSLNYDVSKNMVCSMQLAVSLFNDDTYSVDEFLQPGLGQIKRLFPAIMREFASYNPAVSKVLTKEQAELFYKVVAKESTAEHSYIGYIKTMTYGYGLKKLSKRFLGYEQKTFEETLNGKAHMGQLTGEEVCSYGADDAWVCVRLYKFLINWMINENPAVVPTFFEQENPMINVYSDVWGGGVRINLKRVVEQQAIERSRVAATLRIMKAATRELLPFPEEPHDKLSRYDPKYNSAKYRASIVKWAAMPDSEDDFTQICQVKSALSKQWVEEKGGTEKSLTGMSINYYQQIRAFLYDLCGCSFQLHDGKIQADGEARQVMWDRWVKKHTEGEDAVAVYNKETKDYDRLPEVQYSLEDTQRWNLFRNVLIILTCYKQLAESEQVIKLFINSYLDLTDPLTGRVYPTLNSLLNSRRMALATPNLSQLPKFGGSAYVRSFFMPDEPWQFDGYNMIWVPATPSAAPPEPCEPGEEQVILSADWSGIELVLIGDASGDEKFAEAYSQIPHGDLHTGTAADLLGLSIPDFKARPNPKKDRNEIGKPANFGYWYSGALGPVANDLGWSSDTMWEAVERYRKRYPTGEAWRVGLINSTKETGLVRIPDGHTRIRFESTPTWANAMRGKFAQYGKIMTTFGELVIKKIQSRSGNQAVNSRIQGLCAPLAKRSILRIRQKIQEKNYRARFMFPVHDELVQSVAVNNLWDYMHDLYEAMCTHPDLVTKLKLDASMAIGLNYQAWNAETNPKGQIELGELSPLPWLDKARWGQKATYEEVMQVCDYLFDRLKQPMLEAA